MNKTQVYNSNNYISRVMNSTGPQLIEADGSKYEVLPVDELRGFTPGEIKGIINCDHPSVESLHDGRIMIYDAELKKCPEVVNEVATVLYKMGRPGSLDSIKIRGRVVVCAKKYFV